MNEKLITLLEENLEDSLTRAEDLDTGEVRKQEIDNAIKLAETLNAIDQTKNKSEDDQNRQTLEEYRIRSANEVEIQKCKRSLSDYMLEAFKVIAPTVLSLVGYNLFQKRVLLFEENGRIVSTAGRELHLPNFFKK